MKQLKIRKKLRKRRKTDERSIAKKSVLVSAMKQYNLFA